MATTAPDQPTGRVVHVQDLQVAISGKLTDLATWLPTVELLIQARQRQLLGFQTPATQTAIAQAAEHDRIQARREHNRYAIPGRQWMRPDRRVAAGGATPTPAATLAALSLSEEISTTLHHIVKATVRALGEAGFCAITRLPTEPTTPQLIAHVRELTWIAPSARLLTWIDQQLTWLNDQASRLVDGDAKTALPDPCPWCGQLTLIVYFRDDIVICGPNTRTRRLEACICDDPMCDCKARPLDYRHTWTRTPGHGEDSTSATAAGDDGDAPRRANKERHTWRRLSELIDDRRNTPSKETR